MSGQLFTQYFLTDGIRGTQEWAAAASNCEVFCQTWLRFGNPSRPARDPTKPLRSKT